MIPLEIIIACNMLAARLYGATKQPWWANDPRVWCMIGAGPHGEDVYIRLRP